MAEVFFTLIMIVVVIVGGLWLLAKLADEGGGMKGGM